MVIMLRDADIQALDGHVGSIIRDNEQHHDRLQGLLINFKALLDSYNQLRSDYEEERENREKYKKLARGQVSRFHGVPGFQLTIQGTKSFCIGAG